jgi:putative sigma-54 modulation protein
MDKKVDIYTKELELNNDIRDYVDKKAERLYRFLEKIDETRVDLAFAKTAREANNRYVAQITLRGRGFILRAEERADEIKPAIDLVMDKIERQIERYKGKKYRSRAGAVPAAELLVKEVEIEVEETQPLIARRKKFTLAPMDELEAVEQMNLLGHEDFFVFYNIGTNSINVLYKRRDGSYGIIEPELG